MPHAPPQPQQLFSAIDLYLRSAYDRPPASVTTLVESLRTAGGDLYQNKAFARTGDGDSPRLLLRLGNRYYPHMKLALEPAPGETTYLYRADTHDKHICPPPDHPEYAAFMQLRAKNKSIGDAIEQAWEQAGIPTFRTFLQQDLARRQAQLREIKP
jgi:hypothetical protein